MVLYPAVVLTCRVDLAGQPSVVVGARARVPTGGISTARPSELARVRVAIACRYYMKGR